MTKTDYSEDGHFALSMWCTATKAWHDLPAVYQFVGEAEQAATERGIYRVAYLRAGKRLDLEPFGVLGSD
jgi:hypothetical protein